ncbi:MAG: hypothetical protein Q9167_003320 [Letrouitia subvulpina]
MSYTITLTSPTLAPSATASPTASTQNRQTERERQQSPPVHQIQANQNSSANSSAHKNDSLTNTEEPLSDSRMRMIREYLCGVPQAWRLTDSYRGQPSSLQEGLPNSSVTRSEGDPNSGQPNTQVNAIEVTVLEFREFPVKRQLVTLKDLDDHLNAASRPPNARAYFVPTSWQPVYGLLGASLNIDHDFFALHSTKQPLPIEYSLPSFKISNNHWRCPYMSMDSEEIQTIERCISLWIADSQSDNWTAVVLCDNYEINERAARSLAFHLQKLTFFSQWRPTLVQTFAVSILNPIYDDYSPKRFSSILIVILTVLSSEFSTLISRLAQNLKDAEDAILEISQAETSSSTNVKLLKKLRQIYPHALRRPSTYKMLLRQLNFITFSLRDQDVHKSEVRRTEKLLDDLRYLCQYATELEKQNGELLKERTNLIAGLRDGSSEGGENEKGRSFEQSGENSPSSAAIQEQSIHKDRGIDMGSLGNQHLDPRGQGGPPQPGSPGKSTLEPFARHIQTKIDQIAYITNILLSLSLIATIYGMNLDVFVDGGLLRVKDYLVTALPFAFGIFLVTFGLPALVSRARHLRLEIV